MNYRRSSRDGRYSFEYNGSKFLVKLKGGHWFVDIGLDDIWEPAGNSRKEAIAYAHKVIGLDRRVKIKHLPSESKQWLSTVKGRDKHALKHKLLASK